CWTYFSPERTCRYHRRKKITANNAIASPPRIATRSASRGETGRRGSLGLTGSRVLMPAWLVGGALAGAASVRRSRAGGSCARERAQAPGGVGPPAPSARIVGQRALQAGPHDRPR